jgi:hypothetical protein
LFELITIRLLVTLREGPGMLLFVEPQQFIATAGVAASTEAIMSATIASACFVTCAS